MNDNQKNDSNSGEQASLEDMEVPTSPAVRLSSSRESYSHTERSTDSAQETIEEPFQQSLETFKSVFFFFVYDPREREKIRLLVSKTASMISVKVVIKFKTLRRERSRSHTLCSTQ